MSYPGSQPSVYFSELSVTRSGTPVTIELEIYVPGDDSVELAILGTVGGSALVDLDAQQVDRLIYQLQEARKRLP